MAYDPKHEAYAADRPSEALTRVAADLAPELDRLIKDYLVSKPHTELERFLWDNKVSILRILQSVSGESS